MSRKHPAFSTILILSLLINVVISPFALTGSVLAATLPVIDDFEAGLPTGTDANGVGIGFITFNDPNSTVAISTTATPPASVPGAADPNNVLKMIIKQPLLSVDAAEKFDILVRVAGGGASGQAGAIRHGISRALTTKSAVLFDTARAISVDGSSSRSAIF